MSFSPKIVFRTDASIDIGIGHVMRCITLAKSLRMKGAEISFICRDHLGNLLDVISENGFKTYKLIGEKNNNFSIPVENEVNSRLSRYTKWLGTNWEADLEQTLEVLSGNHFDWVIADHYGIDARWEKAVLEMCHRLMVIDDLAEHAHCCDLLLDQNFGRVNEDYSDLVSRNCTILTGAKYALLRPEFAEMRNQSLLHRDSPNIKKILITMGGIDKFNVTSKVLDALKDCNLQSDCIVNVVLGAAAPNIGNVKQKARELVCKTNVLINNKNMAQLMAESDLAIAAGGSTSWERCCLALPSIIVAIADNQNDIALSLHRAGAVFLINNPFQDSFRSRLRQAFSALQNDKSRISELSSRAKNVTDGQGTSRVVSFMETMK